MSYIPPYDPFVLPTNPWLGGSLSTGPTGLAGQLAGQVPTTSLPYASQGLGTRLAGAAGSIPSGTALFPKGAMLRGGLYSVAGSVGSSLIDSTDIGGQNSNVEQGLQGAAQGVGIGAGVGLLGGPFAGISVPVGAAAGGVIGGAIGVLSNIFGGDDDDGGAEQVLATAIQQAGLDDATTASILDTYEVMLTLAGSEEDEAIRTQMEDAALNQAGQMVLAAMQQRPAAQQNAGMQLALQQQAQQTFEPIAQDIEAGGQSYAAAMGSLMDTLPADYRGYAQANVARETMASSRLADAYRAQAAITPAVSALTQYQQDFQGFAAQLFAQQQAQAAAGYMGGGGQATDITALLQPIG